jgi:hypothetical protein
MVQTYTLYTGKQVQARPGQIVHCDCFGRFLRTVDRLDSGLGLNFRAQPNGTLTREFF